MATYKIYDLGNSVLMGLDVLGTVLELKKEDPITVGGRAHRRYREYLQRFVPENYEPDLHPEIRVKKYFQAQGLEVAPMNVYAAWIATFFSWPLFPLVQAINLYRLMRARARRGRASQLQSQSQAQAQPQGTEAEEAVARTTSSSGGATPSFAE